jgi:hypothetical protein
MGDDLLIAQGAARNLVGNDAPDGFTNGAGGNLSHAV